jgi:2-polyprenyl-3-methyl-5-hydroxy-6-metoxy-1,4-benzoquinol methylase
MGELRRVMTRRAALLRQFDVSNMFEALEESCVPSYLHRNPAAATVAWWRLVSAASFYKSHANAGPILDFGSGTGEIWHVLNVDEPYSFVEMNDLLASALVETHLEAERLTLESLPNHQYAAVFALDSLEHNSDVLPILNTLQQSLRSDGVLILSGPTENWLYRFGRKLSGFDGHYHHTTIYDIEELATKELALVERRRIPLGVPLFSVSAWRSKS